MHQVIVMGRRLAVIAAAIAAKRKGLKTLLVEKYGFWGGMATASLVNPFMSTLGAGGHYREFLQSLTKRQAAEERTFDGELAKLGLDEWLTEEGIDLLFHGQLADKRAGGREKR